MSNMKKYLVTAITLGAIAMCAGALIGATNILTKGPIAEYEKNQINNGIKEIFDGYENLHYANDIDAEIDIAAVSGRADYGEMDHVVVFQGGLLRNLVYAGYIELFHLMLSYP